MLPSGDCWTRLSSCAEADWTGFWADTVDPLATSANGMETLAATPAARYYQNTLKRDGVSFKAEWKGARSFK